MEKVKNLTPVRRSPLDKGRYQKDPSVKGDSVNKRKGEMSKTPPLSKEEGFRKTALDTEESY